MSAVASIRPAVVIFDLGGVLVDWDPRYLYRQLLTTRTRWSRFSPRSPRPSGTHTKTRGDHGRKQSKSWWAEHPQRRELIEAFHRRWPEMLAGEISGTVDVLADLRAAGIRLIALSNWSAETFPFARERFDFHAELGELVGQRSRAVCDVACSPGAVGPGPTTRRVGGRRLGTLRRGARPRFTRAVR